MMSTVWPWEHLQSLPLPPTTPCRPRPPTPCKRPSIPFILSSPRHTHTSTHTHTHTLTHPSSRSNPVTQNSNNCFFSPPLLFSGALLFTLQFHRADGVTIKIEVIYGRLRTLLVREGSHACFSSYYLFNDTYWVYIHINIHIFALSWANLGSLATIFAQGL